MAKLLTDLFYTGFDLNGVPLPGAKLEFFITGTSTPLAVFTDNALTVAHTNPVIADSAGRFAPIYLQDADYKVILKDAADVVIDTIDPVHGAAAGGDASNFLVTPTGSATADTIADLFGLGALDTENVKLHGAKGDTVEKTDGTVTDASAVLSSTSVTFATTDVGKLISVEAAATAGVTITGAVAAPIDAAFQFDASGVGPAAFVDETADFNSATAADVLPFPATEAIGDRFYIGHVQTFSAVAITIDTSGTVGTVTWKYWNGTIWANLTTTDNTVGFTAAPGTQTVSFTPPGDWATTSVETVFNGKKLFYIVAEVATLYTINPILSQGILTGGRVRITAATHGFHNRQTISVKGIVGTTEANGTFAIERAGLGAFDLIGSTFANTYISGGSAHGLLVTTILSVSGGNATLGLNAGASITGTAKFRYGTDDTTAVQTAIDTGKTVVVPNGIYFCAELTLATVGQKMIGAGGQIWAKPGVMTQAAQIHVTADEVSIIGLILDNPDEQQEPGFGVGERSYGIEIEADRCLIESNTVRRFQNGIAVRSTGEWFGNVIKGNHVIDIIGAGSGDNLGGSNGEDRGDGIVSWGADTVIIGNFITAKDGTDARIGIHVEALPSFKTLTDNWPYEDQGATITGNIVRGTFRRSIYSENVEFATIADNVVAGATWWGIGVTGNVKANYTISGNQILFDRPSQNNAGANFGPDYAAVHIQGTTGNISDVIVSDNNIRITGTGKGIDSRSNTATESMENVHIRGNVIDAVTGSMTRGIDIEFALKIIIEGNTVSGNVNTTRGIDGLSGDDWIISNNHIDIAGPSGKGMEISPTVTNKYVAIIGNFVDVNDATTSDGIAVLNRNNVTITGNVVLNATSGCLDLSGIDNASVTGNVLRVGTAGTAIQNYTPTATKIDSANVKN